MSIRKIEKNTPKRPEADCVNNAAKATIAIKG